MPAALAIFAVLLQFGPELADLLGLGTESAWQYVASGAEAAVLWAIMAVVMAMGPAPKTQARRAGLWVCRMACWWAAAEGAERAGCRLAFDMHRRPDLPAGQTLCDAALGVPASALSVLAALLLAVLVQVASDTRERHRAGR